MKTQHVMAAIVSFGLLIVPVAAPQTASQYTAVSPTKGETTKRRRGSDIPIPIVQETDGNLSIPSLLRLGMFTEVAKTDEGQLLRLNRERSQGDVTQTPDELVMFVNETESEIQALVMAINSANHASTAIARLDAEQSNNSATVYPATFISPKLFNVLPAEQYKAVISLEFDTSRSTYVNAVIVEYAGLVYKDSKFSFETVATLVYDAVPDAHNYRSFDSEKCRHLPCATSPKSKPWHEIKTAPFLLLPPVEGRSPQNHSALKKPNYLITQYSGEPLN